MNAEYVVTRSVNGTAPPFPDGVLLAACSASRAVEFCKNPRPFKVLNSSEYSVFLPCPIKLSTDNMAFCVTVSPLMSFMVRLIPDVPYNFVAFIKAAPASRNPYVPPNCGKTIIGVCNKLTVAEDTLPAKL